MATQYRHVNIDNSYTDLDNIGSINDPLNFDEWVDYLTNGSAGYGNQQHTIFYVKGQRIDNSSDTIFLGIDVYNPQHSFDTSIIITNWESEPWGIHSGGQILFLFGNNWQSQDSVFIQGGILTATVNIAFTVVDTGTNQTLNFDNCWLSQDILYITSWKNVYFNNSTLFQDGSNKRIEFSNTIQGSFFGIVNSIVDVNYIVKKVFDNILNMSLQEVTLTKNLNNLTSAFDSFYEVNNISNFGDIQEDWNSTLSATNPLSAEEINYLHSNFNDITPDGYIPNPTLGIEWFGGKRSGIGALNFEQPSAILSAIPLSGNVDFNITFSISATSANTDADEVLFDFGDGNTSTSTDLSAIHLYETPDNYNTAVRITPKNSWYSIVSESIEISAFAPLLSATWALYDKSTLTEITSANTYQNIFLSGTVVSGSPTTVDINFDDEIFLEENIVNNTFTLDYKYKVPGEKTVSITLHDVNKFNLISDTFNVSVLPSVTYYVNINSVYDDNIENIGTSANPFNYAEFITYIEPGGLASATDIFKLQGYRELIKPDGVSTPWTAIQTDSDKRLTIDAWDLLVYGPWLIFINDYDDSDKAILNFKSSILKNGIIYNKPYDDGSSNGRGGQSYFTYMYNMFVVYQGRGSQIFMHQDNLTSGCIIKGSTIYTQYNSFKNSNSLSAFNMRVDDSVIFDFSGLSGTSVINNSTFDISLATLSADLDSITVSNCQFDFTIPDNWPFLKDNPGYNKNLTWLLNNKEILQPFSGIPVPPNPGFNYNKYKNYSTGLFGVSRKDYER